MKKWKLPGLLTILATLSASPAFAAVDMNLPATGTVRVGQIFGDTWAGVQPAAGGNCVWARLGVGGLQSDVNLIGTQGADSISMVISSESFCGFTFTPIVMNGHALRVFTGRGNDSFVNFGVANMFVDGGDHNDFLVNTMPPPQDGLVPPNATGNDGDDVVLGDVGDNLYGGFGNDFLCAFSGTANSVSGGDGDDTFCGSASDVSFTIEHHPPSCTCF